MKHVTDEEFRTSLGNLKYLKDLRDFAKWNRNHPTKAERILWKELKKLKYSFLRQKPIGRFIVDFYCSRYLIVIEVDGDYHDNRMSYDKGRDEILSKMGIKTIRIKNEDVLNGLDKVMEKIKSLFFQRGI